MLFTDEGIDAAVPCGRCARVSYEKPCRVFKTTAEERVAALEVAPAVSCPVRALTPPATAPICALEQRVETLKQAVEGLGAGAAAGARGFSVEAGPGAAGRAEAGAPRLIGRLDWRRGACRYSSATAVAAGAAVGVVAAKAWVRVVSVLALDGGWTVGWPSLDARQTGHTRQSLLS